MERTRKRDEHIGAIVCITNVNRGCVHRSELNGNLLTGGEGLVFMSSAS